MARTRGGEALQRKLGEIAAKFKRAKHVRVGFLEGATYPEGGLTVATVAAIQNFGAPGAGIPPRPFFSNMIEKEKGGWGAATAGALRSSGNDAEKALNQMGALISGQLRQSIIDTNDPPLKPATIKRKGFDKPLIDSSVLINSIDHEVA